MKTVAIVSGGMDSVVLAHLLHSQGHALSLLAFDYGQRHRRELQAAGRCAERLRAGFHRVDLRSLRPLLGGSALTDDAVAVPHGHYADETMRATVVPNRNAIMLAVAWGHAVAIGADFVATAVHAGDHPIYPDCRPEFIGRLSSALRVGTEGHRAESLMILAPFVNASKADIAREGARLGVPFEQTWSCYEGGAVHCGACGTCVERREALQLAGVPDPTAYAGTGPRVSHGPPSPFALGQVT